MSNKAITVTIAVNEKVKASLYKHFSINQSELEDREDALTKELTHHLLKEIIHLTEVPSYQEQAAPSLVDMPSEPEVDELK